jgi:hypothetical protein
MILQQSTNHFLANTSDAHDNGVQINMNMHSSITSKYNKLTKQKPKIDFCKNQRIIKNT